MAAIESGIVFRHVFTCCHRKAALRIVKKAVPVAAVAVSMMTRRKRMMMAIMGDDASFRYLTADLPPKYCGEAFRAVRLMVT